MVVPQSPNNQLSIDVNVLHNTHDLAQLSPIALKAEMRNRLIQLRNKQNYCADCFITDPEWTSTSLGIFICVACCGIHRHLGTHISRVKSIKLDDWTPSLLADMSMHSNEQSNRHYLAHFPRAFKRIDQADPVYLREEIIMDKYLRKTFVKAHEWRPFKVSYAFKRGKYYDKWARRFFKLSNGASLVYYKSQNDIASELGRVHVDKIWVGDVKAGRACTLQVIGTSARSLFLSFETASEMLEWYNYLRLAKAHALSLNDQLLMQLEQPQSQEEFERLLKCSLIVEGYLGYCSSTPDDDRVSSHESIASKSSPSSSPSLLSRMKIPGLGTYSSNSTAWQKIFATLTHDKLFLYKHPLDAMPMDIIIVQRAIVESVSDNEFTITRGPHGSRVSFNCESQLAAQRWTNALKSLHSSRDLERSMKLLSVVDI